MNFMTQEKLSELRKKIDEIDAQIVQLIDERLDIATEVGAIKKQMNVPIYSEEREKVVVNHVVSLVRHPEIKDLVRNIYEEMIPIFRGYEIQKHG
jgi:monofunctional chorismate mutase